jgi:hypothetical protein
MLDGPSGVGKCLDPLTPVLLYNGEIVVAKEIVVGDRLMGDDATPRTVLEITSGKDQMYKIKYNRGEYVVNSSHILSLKPIAKCTIDYELEKYKVEWIEYASGKIILQNRFFNRQSLAESFANHFNKTALYQRTFDIPIKELVSFGRNDLLLGYRVAINRYERGYTIDVNDAYDRGFDFDLSTANEIPPEILFCSIESRFYFIMGLIDAFGTYNKRGSSYIFKNVSRKITQCFEQLVRSVGLECDITTDNSITQTNRALTLLFKKQYNVTIYGRLISKIPVKVDGKMILAPANMSLAETSLLSQPNISTYSI